MCDCEETDVEPEPCKICGRWTHLFVWSTPNTTGNCPARVSGRLTYAAIREWEIKQAKEMGVQSFVVTNILKLPL